MWKQTTQTLIPGDEIVVFLNLKKLGLGVNLVRGVQVTRVQVLLTAKNLTGNNPALTLIYSDSHTHTHTQNTWDEK